MYPFIWNSDVFDLSDVLSSEHKCQDPRYASVFLLLLTTQYKYAEWVLTCATSVENWISLEKFKSSNTALLSITLNASFGDIQLLRCHKITKIWTLLSTCSYFFDFDCIVLHSPALISLSKYHQETVPLNVSLIHPNTNGIN